MPQPTAPHLPPQPFPQQPQTTPPIHCYPQQASGLATDFKRQSTCMQPTPSPVACDPITNPPSRLQQLPQQCRSLSLSYTPLSRPRCHLNQHRLLYGIRLKAFGNLCHPPHLRPHLSLHLLSPTHSPRPFTLRSQTESIPLTPRLHKLPPPAHLAPLLVATAITIGVG